MGEGRGLEDDNLKLVFAQSYAAKVNKISTRQLVRHNLIYMLEFPMVDQDF